MKKIDLEKIKLELKSLNNKLAKNVCYFTGYRSFECPWGFNESDKRCVNMKNRLKQEIERAINCGYNIFLCGMALGFDMICAEIVLELKKIYPNIKLLAALPCKNQDEKWNSIQKLRYQNLLKQVDGIRCVYEKYTGKQCMLERNYYMVNNSSLVIALYDGKSGGTQKTLQAAKKLGLNIILIKP